MRTLFGKAGFTLVEVMVAVAITSILLFSVYGIFASVSETEQRLTRDSGGYHRARVLFDRIGREIRSAYFSSASPGTLFAGGENEDAHPYLDLTTTVASPMLGGRSGGISLVRYELVENEESGGEWVLKRTERTLFEVGEDLDEGYNLVGGIDLLEFRFYGRGEWHEDWNSAAQGLPLLVEVRMEIAVEDEVIPFITTIEPGGGT